MYTSKSLLPLHNCSLRLNTYLNVGAISQTQKSLTTPFFWNCLKQILLKILPASKSLSFEGKFEIWKLSRDLTHKEPNLAYKAWVVRLDPKQSMTPGAVGFSVRSLPGRAVARTGHTKAGIFAIYTLGWFFFPPSLLNRNKNTGFENSGS